MALAQSRDRFVTWTIWPFGVVMTSPLTERIRVTREPGPCAERDPAGQPPRVDLRYTDSASQPHEFPQPQRQPGEEACRGRRPRVVRAARGRARYSRDLAARTLGTTGLGGCHAPHSFNRESVMGIFTWLRAGEWAERWEEKSRWFRDLVMPTGHDEPESDAIKRAAAADVAAMEEEDRKYFRQDGPGDREDDL
jgi:hypothetical protein